MTNIARGAQSNQHARPAGSRHQSKKMSNAESSKLVARHLAMKDTTAAGKCLDAMGAQGTLSRTFFHSLICDCARNGSPSTAAWCADRMVQAGIELTVVTVNSVMDVCAKAGNLPLASHWWQTMEGQGLQPNRISYNTIINACVRAHDAEKAEWWIQRMATDGLTPCLISYSTVIDAWSKRGNLEKAEAWFWWMEEAGHRADAVIYNSLINACAKAGKPGQAEQLLQQMSKRGIQADEKTYNSLINACAKGGSIRKAELWFERMEAAGCKVDEITMGAVMHASAKAGNVRRAEYWLEEMQHRGLTPNLVCYNTVLHACSHAGDHNQALKWFQTLLGTGLEPNKISFNSLIDAYMKAGDLQSAEQWLRSMVSKKIDADHITHVTLERDYQQVKRKAGHHQEASRWAYGVIVKTYASLGGAAGLEFWLGQMVKAGVTLMPQHLDDCIREAPPPLQGMLEDHHRQVHTARQRQQHGGYGGKGASKGASFSGQCFTGAPKGPPRPPSADSTSTSSGSLSAATPPPHAATTVQATQVEAADPPHDFIPHSGGFVEDSLFKLLQVPAPPSVPAPGLLPPSAPQAPAATSAALPAHVWSSAVTAQGELLDLFEDDVLPSGELALPFTSEEQRASTTKVPPPWGPQMSLSSDTSAFISGLVAGAERPFGHYGLLFERFSL